MISIDRDAIQVLGFSWFGSLVNAVKGMTSTLQSILGEELASSDKEPMALAWRKELWRSYQNPYEHWPAHLVRALKNVCLVWGYRPPEITEEEIIKAVRSWPYYPETDALCKLGRRYQVAAISQLDRPTLGLCLSSAPRPFDQLVTSDYSLTYKPHEDYFRLLRTQLKLPEPKSLLVISNNSQIDIEPSEKQGYQSVLISNNGNNATLPTLKEVIHSLV